MLGLLLLAAASAAEPTPPATPTPGAPAPGAPLPAAAPPASAAPAEAPVSQARLPSPVTVPTAPYPASALASGREASVVLEVGIGVDGKVIAARVTESAGPDEAGAAFDAGALDALRAATFLPALDDAGTPTPATILYRYGYTVARAPVVSVEGHLRHTDGTPLQSTSVRAATAAGDVRYATTDADGAFRFVDLPAGAWTIVFEDPAYEPALAPITVADGLVAVAEIQAQDKVAPPGDEGKVRGEVVSVEGERIATEVTERTLSAEEIRFLPGSNGDVVKAVQNLPGVARPPLGTGQLIIRGTAPEDSAAFLDGARIPVVFHFAGLTTVINGDLLEEVSFVPGNASARYGRFYGGMIELRTKGEAPTGQHGNLQVDLYQATLFAESAIAPGAGITMSLRRSYADAVLVPVINAVPGLEIQAPRYYDIQTRLQAKLKETRLDALLLVSDDRFALLGDAESDTPGAVQIGLATQFWRGRVTALTPLGGGWENELRFGAGHDGQSFTFNVTGAAKETNTTLTLREEVSRPIEGARKLGLRFGVDAEVGPQSFLYDVESFGPREEGDAFRFAPAAYAEAALQLGPVRVTPGLRSDALILDDFYAKVTADPRLTARWALSDRTALRMGVGRYSQFPTVRQLLPDGDGNPDLGPAWSLQSSVGIEQSLFGVVKVEGTLFYNHLDDLVVGREDRLSFFTGPPVGGPEDTDPYANDGTGRVCGAELLTRLELERTLGIVSLTLSNSARVKRPGQEETLFTYDQPIVLNVIASQELGKRWRLGGRFRYGSGNPYTPVVNRVYDLQTRGFIPVYGEADSGRLPAFYSLDVRVDKSWTTRWGSVALYFDVQNATNAKNVEVMNYSYDYAEADPITGLPTLPTFGLEVKW